MSAARLAAGRAYAQSLGLELGGNGYEFAAAHNLKGLYTYKSGKFKGMAFFGTGGTATEEIAPYDDGNKYRVLVLPEGIPPSESVAMTEEGFQAEQGARYRVLKQGVLKKKKKQLSVSNRRLTILEERPQGSFLAYFDTTAEGECGEQKGELPLAGALVQQEGDKFVITVIVPEHKNCGQPISFVCASEQEAAEWDATIGRSQGLLGPRWRITSDTAPTEWAAGAKECALGEHGAKYAKCRGPLTEPEARAIAEGLGFSLGGGGFPWSGNTFVKGLYAYDSTGGGTGKYSHCAYFGMGGTDSMALCPITKPGTYRPFLDRPDGPGPGGTQVIDGVPPPFSFLDRIFLTIMLV